jgi:hypothetical protein
MSGYSATELRLLGSVLASASAEKLARIVATLDAQPHRAEADRLLDRARPRLRSIGVPRPLRLTRVLFLPLDGLIVPARAWRPGAPTLPRNALAPLSAAVEAALGPLAARLEAQCKGHVLADSGVVSAVGAALWPAASRALPTVPPPGWAAAGLPDAAYPSLAERCAAAWRHGVALWPAVMAAAAGPPDAMARDALRGPIAEGGTALEVGLRSVLAQAARPAAVAGIALSLVPDGGEAAPAQGGHAAPGATPVLHAIHRALDDRIAESEIPLGLTAGGGDSTDAAAAARATCELIEDLESSPLANQPQRRERLRALRRAADIACRQRFSELLESEFLSWAAHGPAAAGAAAEASSPAEIEETARSLSGLAASGRRLGGAESYDSSLRAAAALLGRRVLGSGAGGVGGAATPPMRRVEALRLAEILVGPDAALEAVKA